VIGKAELIGQLKLRTILVDTCILIGATDTKEKKEIASCYTEFFRLALEAKAVLIISDLTYFEFVRGAKTAQEVKTLNEALDQLGITFILPTLPADINRAIDLGHVYSFHRVAYAKKISFVDCINAAQAVLKGDMLIATEDIKDFPTVIFDCIYVLPIEIPHENSPLLVGFIKANKTKYQE